MGDDNEYKGPLFHHQRDDTTQLMLFAFHSTCVSFISSFVSSTDFVAPREAMRQNTSLSNPSSFSSSLLLNPKPQ